MIDLTTQSLLRMAAVCGLISAASFLWVVLALYDLVKRAGDTSSPGS